VDDKTLKLLEKAWDIGVTYAVDVLGAVVIVIVGWIIANRLKHMVERALDRSSAIDGTLKPFLASLVRYAVLIFVIIAVLAQFGVQTTSIIALLGAAGLAVGLALQGTLSNIAAGLMILFLRPFKIGDYIDAEGISGTVDIIGLFVTEMHTFDGIYVSVPNAQLWNRTVKNFSRLPTRRLDLVFGISYGDDIATARSVLADLMASDDRILKDPAAQVLVSQLGDSAVNLTMRCWTTADDYWTLLFDMTERGKLGLEAAGITIPFPQRDVHLIGETPAS